MPKCKHAYRCPVCSSNMAVASITKGTLENGIEIVVRELACPSCNESCQTVEIPDRRFVSSLFSLAPMNNQIKFQANLTEGPRSGQYWLMCEGNALTLTPCN